MTNHDDHNIERLLESTDLSQRSQIQQSLRKELLERMEHEPNKRSSWVLGAFGAGVLGLMLIVFLALVLGNGGFTVAGSGGSQVEEEDPTESPTPPPSPTLIPSEEPESVDPSIGPLGDMTATPIPFDPNTMPTPTMVPFETTPTPTAHRGNRDEGFTDRLWVLVDLNGKAPIEGVEIIISFGEGVFSGTAGCNRYTGNYTTGVGSIQMTEITIHQTERDTCEDQAVLDQETEYLETLQGVAFYEIADGQLRISAAGVPRWLVFEEKR